ncbi:MAG TPA: Holliday junction branch migration protein RuvA [Ktedonobacterales bacterium]|jgi:Holliday junction DNA helicase RuvA|nr:Holliday junction branch migration protein RuvA [Ktedonobacterales bacterium]
MIVAVRGTLEAKTLDSAYISVGGVTLRLFAPLSALSNLNVGETVSLHTTFIVREDALTLYGFSSTEDRDVFEQMLMVTGVGPKVGLGLLSSMSAAALREAVLREDITRLTLAPGVGKKLAARIVLELKPRFEKGPLPEFTGVTVGAGGASPSRGDVVEALTNLGYAPAEATAAARSLPDDASGSLEDLIFRALRALAKSS